MPLKWKIYSGCCIAYLTFLTFLAGWFFLSSVRDTRNKIDIEEALIMLTLFAIVFILCCKPILSLRFISLLQKGRSCKNRELILFTIFFIENIVFTTIIIGVLCYNFQPLINNWLLLAALLAQIGAAIYLVIFDMQLKNLVYNPNTEDISTIGNNV